MSCRWSGRMNSPECSCRPHTAALQAKHDAFVRRYQDDDDALLESISDAHPDGATSADLWARETSQKGSPPVTAGRMGRAFDFDKMVKAAENLLFDKSMRDGSALNSMNRPRFDRVPPEDLVLVQSFAELLFENYRNGGCLHCSSLLLNAKRDDYEGELVLRALLGLFDLEGETLPRELRARSAKSWFENLPRYGGKGPPTKNWLRDRRINYTVAHLAYLTGMDPTRKSVPRHNSILDAVTLAFQQNGDGDFSYETARSVWEPTQDKENGVALGPAILERWLEQDRVSAIVVQIRAILRRWREQGRTLN